MKLKIKNKGFTLIELLIVIAIIGILAVAFVPMIFDAPKSARDTQRVEDISKLMDFYLAYYAEHGLIPGGSESIKPTSEAGAILNANLDDFGGIFPEDPSGVPYMLYNYTDTNKMPTYKYPFLIYTRVELFENGNFDSNVSDFTRVMLGDEFLIDEGDFYMQLAPR